MKAMELVPLALRVLAACTKGNTLDQGEIEILRQHALPNEAELDINVLACVIVRRETERELAASRTARQQMKVHSEREKIA